MRYVIVLVITHYNSLSLVRQTVRWIKWRWSEKLDICRNNFFQNSFLWVSISTNSKLKQFINDFCFYSQPLHPFKYKCICIFHSSLNDLFNFGLYIVCIRVYAATSFSHIVNYENILWVHSFLMEVIKNPHLSSLSTEMVIRSLSPVDATPYHAPLHKHHQKVN